MNYIEFIINNQNYFEDFITRSTYHSNAIEGSTLSVQETYALLFNNNHCRIENASPREIYEAINHKKALLFLLEKSQNKEKLSHDFLIRVNQIINENIIYVGGYRLGSIRIIGSQKKFPYPLELERQMDQFILEYNQLMYKEITMEDIASMHNRYENIHPFPDGNGRTGRLLINYLLLVKNQCPIVIPMGKRKEYLQYMEDNNILALANLFINLQKEEQDRMNDFSQM